MSDLLNTFRATAAAHPRRIAIQEVDGAAVTYGQLTAMVEELARELRARAGIDELTVSEHDILDGIVMSIAE